MTGDPAGAANIDSTKTSSSAKARSNSQPQSKSAEARTAERKKVSGRARVTLAGGAGSIGKTIDISLTGVCILMDDMLPGKKPCTIEFDIFHVGKRYAFGVEAVSVYSVLASGNGIKVGFQFGPLSPAAQTAVLALLG